MLYVAKHRSNVVNSLDMVLDGYPSINEGFLDVNMVLSDDINISGGYWKFLWDFLGVFRTFYKAMSEIQDGDFLRYIVGLGKSGSPVTREFFRDFSNVLVDHLKVKDTNFPVSIVGIVNA